MPTMVLVRIQGVALPIGILDFDCVRACKRNPGLGEGWESRFYSIFDNLITYTCAEHAFVTICDRSRVYDPFKWVLTRVLRHVTYHVRYL